MERWIGRVALVTGASSGIGAAITVTLAQKGMIVIGVARNKDKIEALSSQLSGASGKIVAMKCDVCNEEEIKSVFVAIKAQFGGVDVCINNAGLSHQTPILTGYTKHFKEILEVNVLAPCIITREYMTQLKERGIDDGHIFITNGITGHMMHPLKTLHFYSAAKHAVTAIVEGIRQELREMKSNCRVTSISPGLVKTEFVGRFTKADNIDEVMKSYDKLVDSYGILLPDDIASAVVFVLSAPPRMEVNEIIIRPTAQPH